MSPLRSNDKQVKTWLRKSNYCYECACTHEILLINAETPIIELFRRERNGFWSLYTLGADDSVELKSFGVNFSVAEVYENTSFME